MGRKFYGDKVLSVNYDDQTITFADGYTPPSGANSVPVNLQTYGYVLVQGTVSGAQGVFVVDTGGDITIFCSAIRSQISSTSSGSPGGTRKAEYMELNGVRYDGIMYYDSSATPADTLKSAYGIDGLIGATFLARFHRASFDYPGKKLILEE
ncbi:MAG: hypothetical protein E3J72_22395 [Planctomycetota bacterium]|nr:MAG: hypothetical protein E3J72_22395 [Planctomycetota bacterium]